MSYIEQQEGVAIQLLRSRQTDFACRLTLGQDEIAEQYVVQENKLSLGV